MEILPIEEIKQKVEAAYDNHDHSKDTVFCCSVPWIPVGTYEIFLISIRKAKFGGRSVTYGFSVMAGGGKIEYGFNTVQTALDSAISYAKRKQQELDKEMEAYKKTLPTV